MGFENIVLSDVTNVIFNDEEFAEIVEYNGSYISVIPQIGAGSIKKKDLFDMENNFEAAFYWVKTADVLAPQVGDVLRHNSKEWHFVSIVKADKFMQKLKFISGESAVILNKRGGLL